MRALITSVWTEAHPRACLRGTRAWVLLACAAALVASPLRAQNAWIPGPGEFAFGAAYTFQTYDRYWMGSDKVDFPDTDQQTIVSTLEYGILEKGNLGLALDATVGYVRTTGTRQGAGVEDGLDDVTGGIRLRLVDEYAWDTELLPTTTLRLGGILQGSYDKGLPESPGDGASGFEVSLLLGKEILDTGFGFFGSVGYRYRAEDVPEDLFFSAFLYKTFLESFTISAGYQHVQGLSGPDIGDPGFTFPEVKEISQSIEGGISYRDSGGRDWGIFAAKTVDGRNTSDRLVIGASVAIPFGGESTRLPYSQGPRDSG